jgi:hypothetical protein
VELGEDDVLVPVLRPIVAKGSVHYPL